MKSFNLEKVLIFFQKSKKIIHNFQHVILKFFFQQIFLLDIEITVLIFF